MSVDARRYFIEKPHADVGINPDPFRWRRGWGRIVTLSGPSGVGKTTMVNVAAEMYPDRFTTVPVMTSRPPRGERFFEPPLTSDQLIKHLDADDFLYWMRYGRNTYLLPAEPVHVALDQGLDVVIDTPTPAARALKQELPGLVTTVFVSVLHPERLLPSRLRRRGSDDADIARRMRDLPSVLTAESEADIVVYNHSTVRKQGEDAVNKLVAQLETQSTL